MTQQSTMDFEREKWAAAAAEREQEYRIAQLRSHEIHMRHIYSLRWGALGLSGATIVLGAAMLFYGLTGNFDWAIEAPKSVGAKLTNASPGIVFATVGLLMGLLAIAQKPVNYETGGDDDASISRHRPARGLRANKPRHF